LSALGFDFDTVGRRTADDAADEPAEHVDDTQ
jgi:hypothetical protein